MANGGMKNSKTDMSGACGPTKVVPYRDASTYIKGCGQSYAGAKEGKTPFHARTQDYCPEEIKDHTGGRGSKGTSQVGRAPSIPTTHTGGLPAPIRGPLFRRDNGGR